MLTHPHLQRRLADGFKLGKNVKVRPFGEYAGRGEDYPVYNTRLLRDGWILKCEGESTPYRHDVPIRIEYKKPIIYEKCIMRERNKYFLQMQLRGIGERNGDKYVIDHEVFDEQGSSLLKLVRTSWSDWDSNGDLLYAKAGKLFRLWWKKPDEFSSKPAIELIDLLERKFTPIVAPAKARKW